MLVCRTFLSKDQGHIFYRCPSICPSVRPSVCPSVCLRNHYSYTNLLTRLIFGMKAYLINMHLLVPRSRSCAKVKVKCKGYTSQKMAVSGAFMFHKHILFFLQLSFFYQNPILSLKYLLSANALGKVFSFVVLYRVKTDLTV